MYFLLQIAVAKQVPYSTYHEEIRNTRNTNRKNICFQTRYGNSALSATSSAGTQIEDNNKSNIGIVNMGGHFWKSRPLGSFVFCHLKYECFFLAAGPLLRMHVSTLQNVHSFHVTFLLHKSSIHKLFAFILNQSTRAMQRSCRWPWRGLRSHNKITLRGMSCPNHCVFWLPVAQENQILEAKTTALCKRKIRNELAIYNTMTAPTTSSYIFRKNTRKKNMSLRWLRAIA